MVIDAPSKVSHEGPPSVNDFKAFADRLETHLANTDLVESISLYKTLYPIVPSPFTRGTCLLIHRNTSDEGREVSIFPVVYPHGSVVISTIFSEKTPRLTIRYKGLPDNEEVLGYEISSFEHYFVPGNTEDEVIFENLISYSLDSVSGTFQVSGLQLMEYSKDPHSRMKMYTLNRWIKADSKGMSGRLYQNISDLVGISGNFWLARNFTDNGKSLGDHEYYESSRPVLITSPAQIKGRRREEMNFIVMASIVISLRDSLDENSQNPGVEERNNVRGGLREAERKKLFFLLKDGVKFPTFLD